MDEQTSDVIALDGVNKTFHGTHVIQNVCLRIPSGCVYVLRGGSKAGKTTVLRLMLGLDRPDSGSVRVDGFDAWEDRAILRHRIGYMPQRFGNYPFFTIEEYLDLFIACYAITPNDRAQLREELLELAELADRRIQDVNALSTDDKQALALARCLIHDPDVLVLDEPLAGLTEPGRESLFDTIRELANLGKTVVMSTRDPFIPVEPYSRVGVLVGGELMGEISSQAVSGT